MTTSPYLRLDRAYISYPVVSSTRQQSILSHAARAAAFGLLGKSNGDMQYVNAINGISLDLKDKARLGLIGRNGSGKTTLLKTLAGIYFPDRGSREVRGRIASLLSIGSGLDQEKSGYENVAFLARLFGLSKAQLDVLTADVEEFTELGPFLNMPVRVYSAGMSIRLSFALATGLPGDILIIDEVLAAGDAQFMHKAVERMKLRAQEARIVVLASHWPEMLKQFCDVAIWLQSGKLLDAGTPEQVWANYAAEQPQRVDNKPIRFDTEFVSVSG
jgi:ABC-type polysaccharide/polyol phosphate transport system ATPase subunit